MVANEDDSVTVHAIGLGILNPLEKYFKSKHGYIRKEACWLMSNILCSGRYCIKKIIEHGKLLPLII